MTTSLSDIAARYNLRRRSNKWAGPCPRCNGSKQSDKFNLYDDGGFKCYSCDFNGDRVQWLKEMDGLSCPEAHLAANVPCTSTGCPVYHKCRMGDGSGSKGSKKHPQSIAPKPKPATKTLPDLRGKSPKEMWLCWASALLAKSEAKLQEKTDILSWLDERGIDRSAVKRFRLGWMDHDIKIDRASIGLTPQKNGKPKLWIPGGLVVPIFKDGQLHRLRIRRTAHARAKFLDNLKYVWVEGSGNEPLAIYPRKEKDTRGAVIVEAELDAYATAMSHDEIMVVAIGSVRAGVGDLIHQQLEDVPTIMVALDADLGKGGKIGPGPEAFSAWVATYPHAEYWPVLVGKDPGDYVKEGHDLRLWIEAGLPPKVAKAEKQDLALSPVLSRRGVGGKEDNSMEYLEVVEGLKWCPVCYGDKFLAGDGGGYFCVECSPVSNPGRLVRAERAREEYLVS